MKNMRDIFQSVATTLWRNVIAYLSACCNNALEKRYTISFSLLQQRFGETLYHIFRSVATTLWRNVIPYLSACCNNALEKRYTILAMFRNHI